MTREQLRIQRENNKRKILLDKKLNSLYRETSEEVNRDLMNLLIKYGNGKDIAYSDLVKYNRLQEIRSYLVTKLSPFYSNLNNIMITDLIELFRDNFLSEMFILESASMVNFFNSTFINDEMINIAVMHKIKGLTLSDRLIRNKNKVVNGTVQTLSKGLLLGKSIDKISKDLSMLYYQDKNKSKRIARTELHRIQETSTHQADMKARDIGLKFDRKWVATLNNRTRDTHRRLDGQFEDDKGLFYSSGGQARHPGDFGIAKEDIYCRCTTIAVFQELPYNIRYSQDNNKYINYKSFDEWKFAKGA